MMKNFIYQFLKSTKAFFCSLIIIIIILSLSGCLSIKEIEEDELIPIKSNPMVITSENIGGLALVDRWGKGIVHDFDYSPTENTVVVSTSTGVFSIDVKSLEIATIWEDDISSGQSPYSIAYSPDGKYLAFAQEQVLIRDLSKQDEEKQFHNVISNFTITDIAFSSNGRSLVTMGFGPYAPCDASGGIFQLYDIETEKLLYYQYFCPESSTYYFRIASNGTVLFTGRSPKTWEYYTHIVDSTTGQIKHTYQTDGNLIIDYSADGEILASQDNWFNDNRHPGTDLINVNTNNVVNHIDGDVIFLPNDDKILVQLEKDLWEIQDLDGNVQCKLFDDEHVLTLWIEPYRPKFQVRHNFLIIWNSWYQEIQIWNTTNCNIEATIPFPHSDNEPIFSSDNLTLATGSTYYIHLWNTQNGSVNNSIPGNEYSGPNKVFAFNPTSSNIIVGTEDDPYILNYYNINSLELIKTISGDYDNIDKIIYSPDGSTFVTLQNRKLLFWNANTYEEKFSTDRLDYISSAQLFFSPDSTKLAVIQNRREEDNILFFDVNTGELIDEIAIDLLWNASMSPDWSYFAADDGNGNLTINDLDGENAPKQLIGHNQLADPYSYIKDIEISPDGGLIASVTNNNLRFWDPISGKLLAELTVDFSIYYITFSSDGQRIASTGRDGTLRIWEIKID